MVVSREVELARGKFGSEVVGTRLRFAKTAFPCHSPKLLRYLWGSGLELEVSVH